MKLLAYATVSITLLLISAPSAFAADQTGGLNKIVGFTSLGDLITKALPIVFGLVALVAVVIFAIGALRYIISRGDSKAVDGARGTMTGAVIGLVIVLGAVSVSGVFEAIFGQGFLGGNQPGGPIINGNFFDLACAFKVTTGSCIGAQFPDFGHLVTFILLLLLTVGGLVFFFMLLWGGLRYMIARGDEKAVQEARGTLTNATVGLLLMIAAIAIIRLLAAFVFKSGNLIST